MRFRVRFTQDAQANLERLYDLFLQRDDGDFTAAEDALDAIRHGTALLETSPFSCRSAASGNAFLRELIIAFGSTGYVALFEIDNASTVTVLATRHQREDDFR
jgi:plasmid stabilization system protein ParE